MELFRRFCALSSRRRAPSSLLVVAHPDDEIIGAGARISHVGKCHVVHVTDGAPRNLRDSVRGGYSSREAYAQARFEEAREALALARTRPVEIRRIGITDQESAWHLVEIVRFLVTLLREIRPDLLLTHSYEGGHPDHDSVSFASRAACEIVRRRKEQRAPVIIEMAGYHAWCGEMRTGKFLPVPGDREESAGVETRAIRLSAAESRLKKEMLACHRSQRAMLDHFSTEWESFRLSPKYDFREPPHDGSLFYEWFDWGIKSGQWRQLAALAHEALVREKLVHERGP